MNKLCKLLKNLYANFPYPHPFHYSFLFPSFLEQPFKKKKMCYASASEKIANLAEEKESLVCLQKELVKQELEQSRELHQLKIKHMNEEHELKMLALQYECDIKKNIFSS